MLTELRDIRTNMAQYVDRLGRLEKTLRSKLKDEAGG
jgi:hypothetical protein